MQPGFAPAIGNKRRPLTIDNIDRRTKAARKIKAVLKTLQRSLNRQPTQAERLAMERVATLCALAEHARVRLLIGADGVSPDAVTGLSFAANAPCAISKPLRGIGPI